MVSVVERTDAAPHGRFTDGPKLDASLDSLDAPDGLRSSRNATRSLRGTAVFTSAALTVRWGRCVRPHAHRLALAASAALIPISPMLAQERWILDEYRMPVTPLKGRAMGDPDLLARPAVVLKHGSRLVVLDNYADERVLFLDARTGRTLGKVGRKGGGPSEFMMALSVDADPANANVFWVYDAALRRLTRMDLGGDFGSTGRPQMTTRRVTGLFTDLRWTKAGDLVGPGILSTGRVGVVDQAGNVVRHWGPSPPGNPNVPMSVRQEAYRSSLAMSPARDRFVLAARYADRMEFFSSDGRKLGDNRRPFAFEPKFTMRTGANGPVMASGDDMRFGYIAVAATERHVFGLFSGRTRNGFTTRASFANFVHVYDWNGTLLHVFRLDSGVQGLAVEPDGSRLYALRHDPMPSVVTYDLPRL